MKDSFKLKSSSGKEYTFWTIQAFSKKTGISVRTLYRMAKKSSAFRKVGGSTRVIEELFNEDTMKGGPPRAKERTTGNKKITRILGKA